jgi:anti-sigma B factor antagonist
MRIEERQVGDVVILDLKGRMTLGCGDEQLKDKVQQLMAAGHRKILINLAKCPYMDSAGLGEICRDDLWLRQANGVLKLLDVPESIENLLSITKLLTAFELFENEAEAIKSFG